MRSLILVLVLGTVVLVPNTARAAPREHLVAASARLRADCRSTARAVGYPVPCPTRVPRGLVGVGGRPGCSLSIIGPGLQCPNTHGCWCGWVVGSSAAGEESLDIVASPQPRARDAQLVNGPAWYPSARTRPLGWIFVRGRRMREVWVPALTNDESSFSDHVALIWTESGHSYAVGFRDVDGLAATRRLDRELAEGIRMVGP